MRLLIFIYLIGSISSIEAQEYSARSSLKHLIDSLERESNYQFLYKAEWIEDATYSIIQEGDLVELINHVCQQNGLKAIFREKFIILIPENKYQYIDTEELQSQLEEDIIVIDSFPNIDSQAKVTFTVKDGKDGSLLTGVQIFIDELGIGEVSDINGKADFRISPGLYTVSMKYVGYAEASQVILVKSSGTSTLEMFESLTQLEEVTVSANRVEDNIEGSKMGTNTISLEVVKRLPAIYGEVDVVKSVTLLPGVSTGGEGTQGFNVRGSDNDQNLLLLDGATIYNASHLFGFFSNINSNVVGGATLYKSGIPASFGGRSSSVLDISLKEPSFDQFKANLGLGLVSSKASLEAPIVKGKSSIMLAARVSYLSWILKRQKNLQVRKSDGAFNDLNIKWSSRIGSSDKVSITAYRSYDEFKFDSDTLYNWTSRAAVLNWDHFFKGDFSTRVSAFVSDYTFKIEGQDPSLLYQLQTGIQDHTIETKLYWEPSRRAKLTSGFSFSNQAINPGSFDFRADPLSEIEVPQKERLRIQSAYSNMEQGFFNNRVSTEYGLRVNYYQYLGPRTVNEYVLGAPRDIDTQSGIVSYEKGDVISSELNVEPRLSIGYKINEFNSVKMSFNRMHQYIHSISNTSSITPIEIWKASDGFYDPLRNDQTSVGFFRNSKDNVYEMSLELYYRKLHNLIDYKNATRVFLNPNPEQAILNGNGRGYGVEIMLKKTRGRLVGWMNYSYSRAEKKFMSQFETETINQGKYFPSENDRPHKIVLAGNYQLDKRLQLGVNFTYNSGIPFTGPDVKYISNGVLLTHFSERNNYRIPDYHRLDLSLTLEESNKKDKKLKGSWVLSFYNVYARKNPYSVFIGDRSTSSPAAYKLAILGRMFPALSYNLRFN